MAITRAKRRRGFRHPTVAGRGVDRLRVDLLDDALEAYAGVRAGATVEASIVLDPFGIEEAGYRPDGGDLLEARPSGVDARGRLEHHLTPDGEGILPALRVDGLAILLCGSEGFPTGARLEVEGFLYASHVPWDRHHGARVRGASRRWRVDRVQRRDPEQGPDGPRIVRTTLDGVPPADDLDELSLVELVLRSPRI